MLPSGDTVGAFAVLVSSTRASWSSSTAVEMSCCLASVCTVLSGTPSPELAGLIAPSSVANATARQIEAISRNSDSGSRRAMRRVPAAISPSFTSTGLRRCASPERTAALPAAVSGLPLLEGDAGGVGSSVISGQARSVSEASLRGGRGQRSKRRRADVRQRHIRRLEIQGPFTEQTHQLLYKNFTSKPGARTKPCTATFTRATHIMFTASSHMCRAQRVHKNETPVPRAHDSLRRGVTYIALPHRSPPLPVPRKPSAPALVPEQLPTAKEHQLARAPHPHPLPGPDACAGAARGRAGQAADHRRLDVRAAAHAETRRRLPQAPRSSRRPRSRAGSPTSASRVSSPAASTSATPPATLKSPKRNRVPPN